MKKNYNLVMSILFVLFSLNLQAQAGLIDPTFNSGQGANGWVRCSAIQPDGKIIIGGAFTAYNGTLRNRIARLNQDGTLDLTFNVGNGADGEVRSIAILSDGKIIIAGSFTNYNDVQRRFIAKLNADGSLDTTFTTSSTNNAAVITLVIQPDNKILIGGFFTNFGGQPANRIARLNADGSFDNTFNVGSGFNEVVYKIIMDGSDKIIVGGAFSTFNEGASGYLTRLNLDGSKDNTFDIGSGFNNNIFLIARQNDGKLIIGGFFSSLNGNQSNGLIRINSNGSIDTTFNTIGNWNVGVYTCNIQTDGRIILGGEFSFFSTITESFVRRLCRLNPDGSLDTNFYTNHIINGWVFTTELSADNKLFVGGNFSVFQNVNINNVAKVQTIGNMAVDNLVVNDNLTIHPNPVSDKIIFTNKNLSPIDKITFYDFMGRLVKTYDDLNVVESYELNINDLPKAIYMVEIRVGRNIVNKKLVKR